MDSWASSADPGWAGLRSLAIELFQYPDNTPKAKINPMINTIASTITPIRELSWNSLIRFGGGGTAGRMRLDN